MPSGKVSDTPSSPSKSQSNLSSRLVATDLSATENLVGHRFPTLRMNTDKDTLPKSGGEQFPFPEPKDVEIPRKIHGTPNAGGFSWPSRFSTSPPIALKWENDPWIKYKVVVEDDDLSFFLNTEENWAADQCRVESIRDIFHGETLRKLQAGDPSVPGRKMALLIDGNNQNGNGKPRFRTFLGGLSPARLLSELQKKRYQDDLVADETLDLINAERRLIYITDLDSWGILALVATAPESLSRLLGDCILNYVSAKSSLGVAFSTEGPETFALQFSFPFRAWRSSRHLIEDNRVKRSTDEPLRSSRDVTFLRVLANSKPTSTETDGIYASHMSCMITGFDQSRWTGLVLVETWFEEHMDEPAPDMIVRYENDAEDGMISDPLCRGKDDVTRSEWLPRPYFARVLEIRIMQLYREWVSVISNLEIRIRACAKRHKDFLRRMRESARKSQASLPLNQERDLREFEGFEDGMSETKETLEEISQDLQETVRSGESFMATDVNYFLNYDGISADAARCMPHLTQIRRTFNDLRLLHQRLGDLQHKCKELVEDGLSARKRYLLQLQIGNTQPERRLLEPRILAWTTIMAQPLIITAAVFGCDDIITFKRTWISFAVVMVIVGAVMVLMVAATFRYITGSWRLQSHSPVVDLNQTSAMSGGEQPHDNKTSRQRQPLFRWQTFLARWLQVFQEFIVSQIALAQRAFTTQDRDGDSTGVATAIPVLSDPGPPVFVHNQRSEVLRAESLWHF